MPRPATDPETKARALRRAEEVGAAQAGRELGIPAATIRAWKSRATPAERPTASRELGVPDDGAFERRVLERAKRAVEAGIRRLEELIPTAKGVQSIAISTGILLDKAAALDRIIAEAQEREVRIAERDAQMLVAMFKAYFTSLGLPETPAMRKVWVGWLRQTAVFREDADAGRSEQPPEPEPEPEDEDDGTEVVTGEVVPDPPGRVFRDRRLPPLGRSAGHINIDNRRW